MLPSTLPSKDFSNHDEIRALMSDCNPSLCRSMIGIGILRPLCPYQEVELLRSPQYTERDALFFRRYFEGIPTAKQLQEALAHLLNNVPALCILPSTSSDFVHHPTRRINMESHTACYVECVIFKLREATQVYVENAECANLFCPTASRMF